MLTCKCGNAPQVCTCKKYKTAPVPEPFIVTCQGCAFEGAMDCLEMRREAGINCVSSTPGTRTLSIIVEDTE